MSRGPYRKGVYLSTLPGGWAYKRGVPTSLRGLVGRKMWSVWLGSSTKLSEDVAAVKARALAAAHDTLLGQLQALSSVERQEVLEAGGFEAWRSSHFDTYADHYVASVTAELQPDPEVSEETQAHTVLEAYRAKARAGELQRKISSIGHVSRKIAGTADRPKLLDLVELWEKKTPSGPKRRERVRLYISRFVELVGDLEAKEIRPEHIDKFRDKLQAQKYSSDNTDQHLNALRAVFKVGVKQRKLSFNPAQDVKADPDTSGVVAPTSEDFTADEVQRIFAGLKDESDDFRWTIKLLAYHGMRSGEACFLRCSDVLTMYGVPVLDIHNRKGGRIKNRWSIRQVPIHPKCRGIVDYAQKVIAAHPDEADPWLFMSYYPTETTTREHSFQNDANGRFLRQKVGITQRRPGKRQYDKSIHSFRHRFSTLCREVEMPDAIKYALKGHKLGKGEGGNYGDAPSLKLRAQWIKKVDPLKG